MSADGRIYDGHKAIFGQDSETDPSYLRADVASKAVNRVFRGGRNRTRPAFIHRAIIFDNQDDRNIFECGNLQGAMCYRKKLYARRDCLIVAVAGVVFALVPDGLKFKCTKIIDGLQPELRHVWFEQAEEWLYVSNGKDLPYRWNGSFQSTAEQSQGKEKGQMPVCTLMKYAHGRMFISDENNHILASDVVYGNGFTNTANTWYYTENTYWSEGGYFGMPANLGSITGMAVVQRTGRDLRGQGEVLVMGESGGQAIEASLARVRWKDEQVQSVTLMGRGCSSFNTLINVNNDAFFRSDDGLSSYLLSRKESEGDWSLSKISREVGLWMDQDTKSYLSFVSSIYFNNRVLTTVSPRLFPGRELTMKDGSVLTCGQHFFHNGIVALDLDKAGSSTRAYGDSNFNWDGLWTGARPVTMSTGVFEDVKRAFILSFDSDEINRIYELDENAGNDEVEGMIKKIEWFYVTKRFDWGDSQRSNSFETKKLIGGQIRVSEIKDVVRIKVEYRADYHPQWRILMPEKRLGVEIGDDWKFSQPKYGPINFPTPKEECNPGSKIPANRGSEFQIKVSGEGSIKIDRLRIAMPKDNDPNSPQGDCENGDEILLDAVPENDYEYSIV